MKNVFIATILLSIIASLFFISDKAFASEKPAAESKPFPYTLKDSKQSTRNYKIEDYHFTELNLSDNDDLKIAYLKAGDIEAGGIEVEQNLHKAVFWFEQAAKLGLVEAMHRLGDFHQFNISNQLSKPHLALQWYTRAASKGYLPSIKNLSAIALAEGKYNDAKMWLNAAVKKGDTDSIVTLANHYFLGLKPFPKDLSKAVNYYEQAAEKGHYIAQLRLGILLATGKGLDKDVVSAFKWLSLSADNGHKQAEEYLTQNIIPNMSKEEITSAEALIKEYKTKSKMLTEKTAYQSPVFSLADFKKDFLAMESQNINVNKPITWIYYFTGYTDNSLVKSAVELEQQGFTPIGTYSDRTVGFYWLEVEHTFQHTPESLFEQVEKLQRFAMDKKLRSFEKLDLRYNKSNE